MSAAAVGISCSIPQIARLSRSSHADGVSFWSVLLGVLSTVTWLVYGAVMRVPVQVGSNLLGLCAAVITFVLLGLRAGTFRVVATSVTCAVWATVVAAGWLFGGSGVITVAATVISLVTRWPQVVTVCQRAPLGALSPASVLLAIVSALAWLGYGFGVGQPAVWATSLVSMAVSSVVLWRRCPPRQVGRALARGRWGRPGQVLVSALVPVAVRVGVLTRA